jgi:hypothetical protein
MKAKPKVEYLVKMEGLRARGELMDKEEAWPYNLTSRFVQVFCPHLVPQTRSDMSLRPITSGLHVSLFLLLLFNTLPKLNRRVILYIGVVQGLKEFDDTRCGCVTKNRSKLFEPKDRPYMLTLDVLV